MLAKVLKERIGRLYVAQKKMNQSVGGWSDEKKKAVEEQYASHIANLGNKNGCLGSKIEDLVPPNVVDYNKYYLLLSIYIRFK